MFTQWASGKGVEHAWPVCVFASVYRGAENIWWISLIYACVCSTEDSVLLWFASSHELRQLRAIDDLLPKLSTKTVVEKVCPLHFTQVAHRLPSQCACAFINDVWEMRVLMSVSSSCMYHSPCFCSKTCLRHTHTEASLKITPQSTTSSFDFIHHQQPHFTLP